MTTDMSGDMNLNGNDGELTQEALNRVVGGNGLTQKPTRDYVLEYGTPGHFSEKPKRDYVLEYGTPGHIQ